MSYPQRQLLEGESSHLRNGERTGGGNCMTGLICSVRLGGLLDVEGKRQQQRPHGTRTG